MAINLHTWTPADKPALMALCNAVDRTFLSDRLPYPYTEAEGDWWLGMVAENEGKEGVLVPTVHDGLVDVEQNGIYILGLVENLHMVGETDAQKIVPVDFGRHRRPILKSE